MTERWSVFAWDADGDMGDGITQGPYKSERSAERRAEAIRAQGVEAMLVRHRLAVTPAHIIADIARGKGEGNESSDV